jgi:concentrative nucleoside transporter, CNT family
MGTEKDSAIALARQATPLTWRIAIAVGIVALGLTAFYFQDIVGPRGQAAVGVACFIGLLAACSVNLRAVNWRTVLWGFGLQVLLALFVIRFQVPGFAEWCKSIGLEEVTEDRPGYVLFQAIASIFKELLAFSNEGARFVFGALADPASMERAHGPGRGFVFAFNALPPIIFVSSFFTVLYYYGVLQFMVRLMSRAMVYLLRTSGAETLSVSANVFMGQTEAPLIIKPYVPGMTRSELLTMMVGGFAHISGGLMAVYIGMKADPVAILATSVMAAPGSLYLSKLFMPETEEPATRGQVKTVVEKTHANVIDAAAAGASDGMRLAINVAAMLIAFLAFIALFDYLLKGMNPSWSLAAVFSWLFAPAAWLMGVEVKDVPFVADLLGTKLVANEFVAYSIYQDHASELSPRTRILCTYALTGFANFGSIGIQLGGIGAMAPTRRADLARLGGRALFVGFIVTLVNAAIAGMLME